MNWKDRLKKEWNENPLQTILVGSLAATAASKLLDSMSSARSRRAYARQIDYKVSRRR
jgi:hypothetical protein